LALSGSLGVAAMGTLSLFTAGGTRTQSVGAGTFAFNLSDPSTGAFTTAISGLAPGDMADRLVTLTNPGGGLNYSQVALSATATTTSLLDSDATNGLALSIDDCSVAWTQATSTSAATCSGTDTTLTAATPLATIIATPITYSSQLASLSNGGVDYLRFHYLLPGISVGTAGLSSSIQYSLTATQQAGGSYH
jgi:spore coat-associated protein N